MLTMIHPQWCCRSCAGRNLTARWTHAAAALRGVAIQRGRARAAFPTTHAAAAALNGAFARLPTPLAAANAIHGYAP